ncbi:23S rRNA (guanosine(2251)-2'-O)-methyltransferase RlmB [Psychroflexus sp. ALD_RP9]|uniref:23S rRNA (guanosine(2251)-2'-O)-methyltransferase RlmB n=1 Tax=Psychroflexus sp. ALD_RP9 TaxID=2777186 RepID=UPI001A8FD355|nr:23S rRNA (guanosine(2251)-2'-O)-methyltransferase RlmB [Psychroflexus sp. ALD_RP9]QSS97759.1 23S rRNA (guanosine(2251)-2'-O)-methyltransferase RlmB [Psychroflexus sp. ALD_RP9]
MEKDNIVFGAHSINEALNQAVDIDKIQINLATKGKYSDIISKAKAQHIKVSFVPHQKFKKYEHLNHQGIIGYISSISYKKLEETVEDILKSNSKPSFLILDGITDVRNFGAIIRTAECTGIDAIIIPAQGSATITKETIKTSAGAAFKLPIIKVAHIKDAIFYLQSSGVEIIGASEKSNTSISKVNFNKANGIILGSEGKGIQPSVLKMLDVTAKIPMAGEINSLNVSVACGMFLYENLRQKS